MFYELSPTYGRDYKTAKEVKQAFDAGLDFQGDYNLGFKPINKVQLPIGSTVLLRYKRNTQVASMKVTSHALKSIEATLASKPPSTSTMERWMLNGIAKATDGCEVEPDGTCEHGKPSWLLKLGMI